MLKLIITLAIGLIGGLTALRLKVPAGAMIGSMLFVALFNVVTGDAYLPQNVRILTQIAAGAFIGAGISYKDVIGLKFLIKPAVLMVSGMIILDVFMGYLMFKVTGINLVTALFACAPGGLVDMSLISSDLGADSSKVAILQLVRLMSVMIIFPTLMKKISSYLDKKKSSQEICCSEMRENMSNVSFNSLRSKETENIPKENYMNLGITMVAAVGAGLLGYISKIPAGTMTFAMVAVGALNVILARGYMPMNLRRFTQVCAGALIGERMTYADIIALKSVILPAFILLVGIIIVNLCLGLLISKISKLEPITALLASAPGGLSDMALIAKDLGGDAPKVALLQLARYVCVLAIFPILIKFIVRS